MAHARIISVHGYQQIDDLLGLSARCSHTKSPAVRLRAMTVLNVCAALVINPASMGKSLSPSSALAVAHRHGCTATTSGQQDECTRSKRSVVERHAGDSRRKVSNLGSKDSVPPSATYGAPWAVPADTRPDQHHPTSLFRRPAICFWRINFPAFTVACQQLRSGEADAEAGVRSCVAFSTRYTLSSAIWCVHFRVDRQWLNCRRTAASSADS